jgi:hypothetical protein
MKNKLIFVIVTLIIVFINGAFYISQENDYSNCSLQNLFKANNAIAENHTSTYDCYDIEETWDEQNEENTLVRGRICDATDCERKYFENSEYAYDMATCTVEYE